MEVCQLQLYLAALGQSHAAAESCLPYPAGRGKASSVGGKGGLIGERLVLVGPAGLWNGRNGDIISHLDLVTLQLYLAALVQLHAGV